MSSGPSSLPARRWLDAFAQPTPVELDEWLGRLAGSGAAAASAPTHKESESRSLARCAEVALASALARPGRHRPTAFALLAAGAFVGYACEAALRADEDPVTELWEVVRRMAATREERVECPA